MKRITRKQILQAINVEGLELHRIDDGYFLFEWGDLSHSVLVPRLHDLAFDDWVAEGRGFLASHKDSGK